MVRERFLRGGRLHLVEKRTDVGALIGGKGADGFEDVSDGRHRIVEDSVRRCNLFHSYPHGADGVHRSAVRRSVPVPAMGRAWASGSIRQVDEPCYIAQNPRQGWGLRGHVWPWESPSVLHIRNIGRFSCCECATWRSGDVGLPQHTQAHACGDNRCAGSFGGIISDRRLARSRLRVT